GEVRRGVLHRAETEVAPVGGGHRRRRPIVVIDDAEGDVALPQEGVDLLFEPGRMAELERGAQIAGDQLEHALEPGRVAPEVRRELEEQRPQLGPEQPPHVAKKASGRALLQKKRTGSSTARRRWMWVIRWEAFSANRKPSGVAAAQPLTVFEFGSREKG